MKRATRSRPHAARRSPGRGGSTEPASPGSVGHGRRVLSIEADALAALAARLDARFDAVVQLIADRGGKVVVTGMGKSGHVGRKIAATLASTGTPAFFLHPAEAIHGDLGVVRSDDVVVALSYSGETDELLLLIETIRRLGAKLIAITGNPASTLAQAADVALDCHVAEEACPMNLVPTASTTAALALGDALAMTLLVEKGFREEDFANLHPGGKLGKRLMRVERLMHTGDELPIVDSASGMRDVVDEMSRKGLGMTCVVEDGRLVGIITDGDLRRHMRRGGDVLPLRAAHVMTLRPIAIERQLLAAQALHIMEERKITSLVVADADGRVEGVLHLHDLWRTELF
jgi:arabinose-5-phosphate isomerase